MEKITDGVKLFYERNPYPGLENKLMMKNAERLTSYFKRSGKMLFPGCGTGNGMVAMAKLRPDLKIYGMDLSGPSMDIARQLGEKYCVSIELKQGDYMKPLPYSFKFEYISLEGTLHHAADPALALINIVNHLENNGLIFIDLYGKKFHRRRLEIVEMLDLLQQENNDLQQRFSLFKAMQVKLKKKSVKEILMSFSPRVIWNGLYEICHHIKSLHSDYGYSVNWKADFKRLNQLWTDQYNHPNEKTYDIFETKQLLESANLEVVEMFGLGKVRMEDIPAAWGKLFLNLDTWSQYRLMELYHENTTSVSLLAKKT